MEWNRDILGLRQCCSHIHSITCWLTVTNSSHHMAPSPPADNNWTMIRGKIIRTILCYIVYCNSAQWYAHTWPVFTVNCSFRFRFAFCMFLPFSSCVVCFCSVRFSFCSTNSIKRLDGKNVFKMTYFVSIGTWNLNSVTPHRMPQQADKPRELCLSWLIITFCMSCRWYEMYSGHVRLCVCLSVCLFTAGFGWICNPVYGLHCYNNIARMQNVSDCLYSLYASLLLYNYYCLLSSWSSSWTVYWLWCGVCCMQVSMTTPLSRQRSQIAIPAQGMIEIRDALTDLLNEFGSEDQGLMESNWTLSVHRHNIT